MRAGVVSWDRPTEKVPQTCPPPSSGGPAKLPAWWDRFGAALRQSDQTKVLSP
jgi:hypothetical protein